MKGIGQKQDQKSFVFKTIKILLPGSIPLIPFIPVNNAWSLSFQGTNQTPMEEDEPSVDLTPPFFVFKTIKILLPGSIPLIPFIPVNNVWFEDLILESMATTNPKP